MKHIYSTLFLFLMATSICLADPFEVYLLVNNDANTLTVRMRNNTSNQPTTAQNISSITMRLLGQVGSITSIASTNYTMKLPSTTGNTQVITMNSTSLPSPENWVQGQWVTVVVYNLSPGTYTAASFSVQADLDGDNSDVVDPIMSVQAAGVFNISLTLSATILPVDLANFTAIKEEGNAKLTWTTLSETNNEGFEIEKSTDGLDFVNIGWVEGNGNSDRLKNYHFIDESLIADINFYRLKQIDFDGNFKYSEVRSLKGESNTGNFSIYPNPSFGSIMNIEGTSNKVFLIEIYTSTGKRVMTKEGLSTEIDCGNLDSGIYLVKINQGSSMKVISWVKK